MESSKIVSLRVMAAIRTAASGRLVHCHGVFDLLHPGHIRHLEQARCLGNALVVSITPDAHVNKGPGRPVHSEQDRAYQLAALQCVDYVTIAPTAGTREAIHAIRPDIFCKGLDYESKDMSEDEQAVREVGGEIRLLGSEPRSSSAILNQQATGPVADFCRSLRVSCPPLDFQTAVESFKDLRVLVIGEGIGDIYRYVTVQGLTSKNRVVSVREDDKEAFRQGGGVTAVANHVREFCPYPNTETLAKYGITKERFVERRTDGELNKLFSVNRIMPGQPEIERWDLDKIGAADVVVAVDYGHGMFNEMLRREVQSRAKFLVINCQTNSANFGYNLISKRWKRADAFALDEQELTLDAGDRDTPPHDGLRALQLKLGAKYAWLTRGPVETIGMAECPAGGDLRVTVCPPFETNPIDTVGAGDAFLSVAGLAAAKGLPIDLATFMGQLAGAQAVKIVGNEHPISKAQLIRTGMAMLA